MTQMSTTVNNGKYICIDLIANIVLSDCTDASAPQPPIDSDHPTIADCNPEPIFMPALAKLKMEPCTGTPVFQYIISPTSATIPLNAAVHGTRPIPFITKLTMTNGKLSQNNTITMSKFIEITNHI